MNGKQLKAIIDAQIGNRRRDPFDNDHWVCRYGYYEPMPVEDCYKRVKKIAKRWRKTLGCIWVEDTMRGEINGWRARKNLLPISLAIISSEYFHGEYREGGHRYLLLVDPAHDLWLIEPRAWAGYYPLQDSDDDFFDLYA